MDFVALDPVMMHFINTNRETATALTDNIQHRACQIVSVNQMSQLFCIFGLSLVTLAVLTPSSQLVCLHVVKWSVLITLQCKWT